MNNLEKLFTPRQHEVALLLLEGKDNKEIATILGMAKGTLKTHLGAILDKLNVPNRTKAALRILEMREGKLNGGAELSNEGSDGG